MLNNFYYDQLNSAQKQQYSAIRSAALSGRGNCVLYNVTAEDIKPAFAAVLYENPTAYRNALNFADVRGDGRSLKVSFGYNGCDDGLFREQMDDASQYIDRVAGNSGGDYEICKAAYDWLLDKGRGDDNVDAEYIAMDKNNRNEVESFIREYGPLFTAYGPVALKRGTCNGFAMAYKALLNQYGVECAVVPATATATDGDGNQVDVPHMYNVVEMDGERYYVDLTHGLKQDNFPMIRYDCFLVSKNEVLKYSVPEHDFGCNTLRGGYFHRSGLYFTDLYSLRKYLNSFTFAATGGEIRYRYSGTIKDSYLERITGNIISARCGNEYTIKGFFASNGVGNALIMRK